MGILKKPNIIILLILISSVGPSMAMLRSLVEFGTPIFGFMVYLAAVDRMQYKTKMEEYESKKKMEAEIHEYEKRKRLEKAEELKRISEAKDEALKRNLAECKDDERCREIAFKIYVTPGGQRGGRGGGRG